MMSLFSKDYQECPFCTKKLPKGTIVSDISASHCQICGKRDLHEGKQEMQSWNMFKAKLIWGGLGLLFLYGLWNEYKPSAKKNALQGEITSSPASKANKTEESEANYSDKSTTQQSTEFSSDSRTKEGYPIEENNDPTNFYAKYAIASSKREFTRAEFENYSKEDLQFIAMEILVRNGLKLEEGNLKNRFAWQKWYKPTRNLKETMNSLSSTTQKNYLLLIQLANDTAHH